MAKELRIGSVFLVGSNRAIEQPSNERERQTVNMPAGGGEEIFRPMTESEGWGLRKDQSSLEPDEGGVSHRQRSGGDIRWSAVCQSVANRHARRFKPARIYSFLVSVHFPWTYGAAIVS